MNPPFALLPITEPTLLLDELKCKKNIERMVQKAAKHNLIFRPHFKTHQSKHIAGWFRKKGVNKITVSSLKMARYFAKDGWNDITVAFPVNMLEIDTIRQLAGKIKLNLLVESLESATFLSKNLTSTVSIFIKIDIGYHRTGILPENTPLIDTILEEIKNSSTLKFAGFLGHAGHSYQAKNKQEIQNIHTTSIGMLQKLKERYKSIFPHLILSTGDTPTCSVMDEFTGTDEIRPGNFVFYDLTQRAIRACNFDDIAVVMACPIVAKHQSRNELIIYGGGVHFSKDHLVLNNGTKTIFGKVVSLTNSGWQGLNNDENYLSKLSQEHGTVTVERHIFDKYKVGDVIGIMPVHSCLTANLTKSYLTLDGKLIERL